MLTSCDYAQLIQETYFSRKIDELHNNHRRMSDVHAAFDFSLGKKPDLGTVCIGDPKHYTYKTTGIGETPSFWVLYRYDETEKKIYLLSIAPAEMADD